VRASSTSACGSHATCTTSSPGHARDALAVIEDTSRDAIVELRAMLGVLRDDGGPGAPRRPAPRIDDLAELLTRAREAGEQIELRVDGDRPQRLTDAVSLAAYRIVQESLTNARRHAPGGRVDVRLCFEVGTLEVTVENAVLDSTAPSDDGPAPGLGIVGMAERAAAVGGSLKAEALVSGFRVHARLPYASGS
jgi:signal transduction histidine kinase